MTAALDGALWPAARLGEAMAALAAACGLAARGDGGAPAPHPAPSGEEELQPWVEREARALGVEAQAVQTPYAETERMLRGCGPALLRIPGDGDGRLLAVLGGGGRTLRALGPDGAEHAVPRAEVREALCGPLEARQQAPVEALLDAAGVPPRGRARSRRLLLRQLLDRGAIQAGWLLRPGPGTPLWARLGGRRFAARVAGLLGVQVAQYALFLLSWWVMGTLGLRDRFDRGWVLLWLLLLATFIALRIHIYLAAGRISIEVGAQLKRHLLHGAFRLEPDPVRRMGPGQLLGRTLEVEAIEAFSFLGAMYLVMGTIELGFAGLVLAAGAGGAGHALLLLGWMGVAAVAGVAYCRERLRWTDGRIGLTNALVEQLVGHRTRIAQQGLRGAVEGDDARLEEYGRASARLNRREVLVGVLVPRGWFALGMAALLPAFVAGGASGGRAIAAVGGVLIAYRSFRILAISIEQLGGALVAWKRLAPLREAERTEEPVGSARLLPAAPPRMRAEARAPVLDLRRVTYRHPGRPEPTLREVSLAVFPRDRVLLEGPSGGGKSTLASLASAVRPAQGGLLLLDGLDPASVGHRGWRRRVVLVPQFHENHVLMGSLAFNLLVGREWPPSQAALEEAEAVCRGLGLGPLLERMPGGIFQMVGDTGWQLSHGERSRIYIARAVLQNPDVLILDESFAALDPELFRSSIDYLLQRDSALVLIAHP
ncbi:MAG TPA: ABC transporter ATP-binding protein [Longimicrobium sp.]|nr:ABC transporter ATP-binding protein [Longimicrobium sp.]